MTSARFAAPRTAESRLAATRSAPGSSCASARIADASRTVIRWLQRGDARRGVHRRGIALSIIPHRVGAIQQRHPADVRAPIAARTDADAADRPGPAPVLSAPQRVSPGDPASRVPAWHPLAYHATTVTGMSRPWSACSAISQAVNASAELASTWPNCIDDGLSARALLTLHVTTGGALMASTTRARVRAYRARLRSQGLRPIQIWVPDVHAPGFAEEAHRQSRAVAASHEAESDQAFVDSVSEWPED
jgi:Protein  of unknown function (DUF3018)